MNAPSHLFFDDEGHIIHPSSNDVSIPSLIFVTLKDGVYDDRWMTEAVAGRRELHWCGQTSGKRDAMVRPGTLVALRPNAKTPSFTLVGTVIEKQLLCQGRPSTYRLTLEMAADPKTIARDSSRDRCAHWTVLRHLEIAHDGSYMPQGIYG